jgi:hypothetical protein
MPIDSSFEISSHLGCHRDKSDLQPLTFLPLQYSCDIQQTTDIDQATDMFNYLALKNSGRTLENKGNNDKSREAGNDNLSEVSLSACNKDFDWTFPVRLVANENGCRMTTSVTVRKGNDVKQEALCITGLEKNGIIYFTIQIDTAPTCFIQNQCYFPLYYGQTLMDLSLSGKLKS